MTSALMLEDVHNTSERPSVFDVSRDVAAENGFMIWVTAAVNKLMRRHQIVLRCQKCRRVTGVTVGVMLMVSVTDCCHERGPRPA